MNSVSIGRDGSRIVVESRDADLYDFTIEGAGVVATATVWRSEPSVHFDLAPWFAELAKEWRGWKGEKVFSSIEHELTMRATHSGNIRIDVELTNYVPAHHWTIRTSIVLDPGEELTRVADELTRL